MFSYSENFVKKNVAPKCEIYNFPNNFNYNFDMRYSDKKINQIKRSTKSETFFLNVLFSLGYNKRGLKALYMEILTFLDSHFNIIP